MSMSITDIGDKYIVKVQGNVGNVHNYALSYDILPNNRYIYYVDVDRFKIFMDTLINRGFTFTMNALEAEKYFKRRTLLYRYYVYINGKNIYPDNIHYRDNYYRIKQDISIYNIRLGSSPDLYLVSIDRSRTSKILLNFKHKHTESKNNKECVYLDALDSFARVKSENGIIYKIKLIFPVLVL